MSEHGVLYGVIVAKLKPLEGETTNSIAFAVKATMLGGVMDAANVHHRGKPMSRQEAIRVGTAATCWSRPGSR